MRLLRQRRATEGGLRALGEGWTLENGWLRAD